MQKIKTLSKVIGLTIFIFVITISPNSNRLVFAANLSDNDRLLIQDAISNCTNNCITICFAGVTIATTVETFKSSINDTTINSCLGIPTICSGGNKTQADSLLDHLKTYIQNPNDENLKTILSILDVSAPHDTTGCITDENNSQLKTWLQQLETHEIIATHKASSNCYNSALTLECLKTSIIPKIKNSILALERGDPALASLYKQYLAVLQPFADCPTENNFNALNDFYNNYFVEEYQKIIYSTIGYQSQPNPDEDNCLIEFISVSFWDVVKVFFAPWSEISHMIIRIFAAIALGIRAIVGYVANGFVLAFTVLPQKLGGYVHFAPIYDPNTNTGVWYTILILANLGIVIGMIFVAIATILRIEKYSWKKMLPKLLLVALLANFSLVIIGIFVDISNYLSMTFLAQTSNNQLGDTIKNAITQVSCPLAGDRTHFVPDMTAVTVAIILSGIFLFQFAGLLFYVITRIFTIWVCAATAPLAFLGMAIDADPINNAVKIWRDRFTQAIVSLPILSFVLYFILKILEGIGTQLEEIANSGNALNFPMLIAYAALIIGAAQVLKFVAKSIGIKQIEQGYEFAQKAVTGAVMAGAAMVGGAALTGIAGSQTFRNVGQGLTQLPVLNKVGYKMLDQSDTARFTNIRKSEEKMKLRDKNEILAIANGEAPLRSNKQAYADYMAARNIALKNGWLKYDSPALEHIKKDIQNKNPDLNAKDLVQAFPEYFAYGENGKIEILDTKAPDYSKKVAQNIKKNISAENMPKHTEEIMKAIEKAGGIIDEFILELAFGKTNQLRAFFDNVDEDEYTTGEVFGGTKEKPKPWAGEKGEIATRLNKLVENALDELNKAAEDYNQGKITEDKLIEARQRFYKARDAVSELNRKLQSSNSLKETLNTDHI